MNFIFNTGNGQINYGVYIHISGNYNINVQRFPIQTQNKHSQFETQSTPPHIFICEQERKYKHYRPSFTPDIKLKE